MASYLFQLTPLPYTGAQVEKLTTLSVAGTASLFVRHIAVGQSLHECDGLVLLLIR
jgi:hypothetical protein